MEFRELSGVISFFHLSLRGALSDDRSLINAICCYCWL